MTVEDTVPNTYRVLAAAGLLLLFAAPASAQTAAASPPPPERVALARQVLTAMGAEQTMIAGVEEAMPEQRRRQTNIPAVFWDSMLVQFRRRAPEVVDSMALLYADRFTPAQLNDLLAFYQSPTGQRFGAVQAELSLVMAAVGRRWGARVAADVMKQLVDAGVTFEE